MLPVFKSVFHCTKTGFQLFFLKKTGRIRPRYIRSRDDKSRNPVNNDLEIFVRKIRKCLIVEKKAFANLLRQNYFGKFFVKSEYKTVMFSRAFNFP